MKAVAVYLRDQSWHSFGGARSTMPKYHRAHPGDLALAACSTNIILIEDEFRSDDPAVAVLLCRRCFPRGK